MLELCTHYETFDTQPSVEERVHHVFFLFCTLCPIFVPWVCSYSINTPTYISVIENYTYSVPDYEHYIYDLSLIYINNHEIFFVQLIKYVFVLDEVSFSFF